MRRILAVDGSEQSYEAARALGHFGPAEAVIVLHAMDVPEPAYPTIMPEVARELRATIEGEMRKDGEALLSRVRSILPPDIGPVMPRLEVGKPVDVVLKVAEEERAGLLVLGARGLGPFRELMFGSTSHRILTYAVCPTLIVNRPLPALRRVLLAVQGADDAEAALRFLAQKPFREPVEIDVLTVFPVGQPLWPVGLSETQSVVKEAARAAEQFADGVANRLAGLQYYASVKFARGAPAYAILHEVETLKPDLVMMGSRGRHGMTRFFLGSVSHTVLHRASCPVLVVR